MGVKFKIGTKVVQIVKVFEGVVTDAAIVDGEVHFRVDSVDADGNHTARFFSEDQIEAVVEPEAEKEAKA